MQPFSHLTCFVSPIVSYMHSNLKIPVSSDGTTSTCNNKANNVDTCMYTFIIKRVSLATINIICISYKERISG